ncbi:hypothetical protein BDP27DRAFT_1445744 [Rhodocollybia butyracea]|uniref:Uncharacterized protein n=1 Tax=Rhodocollybia butyracea TaxID=206335 RepID=A0A9P5UAN8_9AGAR|nr:hypothetical protein BDP27DRAFT_1445744 [Rhodocollybia butyracea]
MNSQQNRPSTSRHSPADEDADQEALAAPGSQTQAVSDAQGLASTSPLAFQSPRPCATGGRPNTHSGTHNLASPFSSQSAHPTSRMEPITAGSSRIILPLPQLHRAPTPARGDTLIQETTSLHGAIDPKGIRFGHPVPFRPSVMMGPPSGFSAADLERQFDQLYGLA